jgi:hypothetical protein
MYGLLQTVRGPKVLCGGLHCYMHPVLLNNPFNYMCGVFKIPTNILLSHIPYVNNCARVLFININRWVYYNATCNHDSTNGARGMVSIFSPWSYYDFIWPRYIPLLKWRAWICLTIIWARFLERESANFDSFTILGETNSSYA